MDAYWNRAPAWDRLSLFTSREVLERLYLVKHGIGIDPDKAREIVAHLEQAKQYFESADSAGVLAGPLEQYYGVLAFSRAIVLFLTPSAREATLRKDHGLKATLQGDREIDGIEVRVSEGTFDELLRATENSEDVVIRDTSADTLASRLFNDVWLRQSLPRPPVGARFTFQQLLARISRLRAIFWESLGVRPDSYEGSVTVAAGGYSVTVLPSNSGLPPVEELRRALGVPDCAPLNEARWANQGDVEFAIPAKVGEAPGVAYLPRIEGHSALLQALVARYPDGWSMTSLASLFAASHVLSTLVRYHPTRWADLVNHNRGDRLLPIIGELRRLIQREFVMLGLGELER